MNSQAIQDSVFAWAKTQNFSAPYGVLTGQHTNAKGRKYLSVTFGHARTLDAVVEIYNRNFIILRTNRTGSEVYNDLTTLMTRLGSL